MQERLKRTEHSIEDELAWKRYLDTQIARLDRQSLENNVKENFAKGFIEGFAKGLEERLAKCHSEEIAEDLRKHIKCIKECLVADIDPKIIAKVMDIPLEKHLEAWEKRFEKEKRSCAYFADDSDNYSE